MAIASMNLETNLIDFEELKNLDIYFGKSLTNRKSAFLFIERESFEVDGTKALRADGNEHPNATIRTDLRRCVWRIIGNSSVDSGMVFFKTLFKIYLKQVRQIDNNYDDRMALVFCYIYETQFLSDKIILLQKIVMSYARKNVPLMPLFYNCRIRCF